MVDGLEYFKKTIREGKICNIVSILYDEDKLKKQEMKKKERKAMKKEFINYRLGSVGDYEKIPVLGISVIRFYISREDISKMDQRDFYFKQNYRISNATESLTHISNDFLERQKTEKELFSRIERTLGAVTTPTIFIDKKDKDALNRIYARNQTSGFKNPSFNLISFSKDMGVYREEIYTDNRFLEYMMDVLDIKCQNIDVLESLNENLCDNKRMAEAMLDIVGKIIFDIDHVKEKRREKEDFSNNHQMDLRIPGKNTVVKPTKKKLTIRQIQFDEGEGIIYIQTILEDKGKRIFHFDTHTLDFSLTDKELISDNTQNRLKEAIKRYYKIKDIRLLKT